MWLNPWSKYSPVDWLNSENQGHFISYLLIASFNSELGIHLVFSVLMTVYKTFSFFFKWEDIYLREEEGDFIRFLHKCVMMNPCDAWQNRKPKICYLLEKYWLQQCLIFIIKEFAEPALDRECWCCASSVYSRECAESEPDPEFLSTVRVDNGIRSL